MEQTEFVNKIWANSFLEQKSIPNNYEKVFKRKHCREILLKGVRSWQLASEFCRKYRCLWEVLRKRGFIMCRYYYIPRKTVKNWNTNPKKKSKVNCTKILYYTSVIFPDEGNGAIFQVVKNRECFKKSIIVVGKNT